MRELNSISEITRALQIKNLSKEYFELIEESFNYSRETFGKSGYVFAQIGINSAPCSGNCKFCSLAADYFSVELNTEKTEAEIIREVKALGGISDLFIMTTADYDHDKLLKILKNIRNIIPKSRKLVVNCGDFDIKTARLFKEAGVSGAYHIVRLREGMDTDISPLRRKETIKAIEDSGLELYYCIEPIGAEHSYEEIAEEILFAKSHNIKVMAVMKRVNVPSSPFLGEEIDSFELMKIAAVAMLTVRPSRSMNVHEVSELSLMAGINQLYAEYGINPRDVVIKTDKSRGVTIDRATKLLSSVGLKVFLGDNE